MSAALALKSARAAGIRVWIDGDDLELEAAAPPPPAMLDLLSLHKADLMELLRPANDGWSAEDWQVFFDERAGIAEFDGGLPREEAETRAFDCCVSEWLNRNPMLPTPGRCVGCGRGEQLGDPLLPFGTETKGHTWLHRACWATWCRAREAEAIAALQRLGITSPIKSDDLNNTQQPKGEKE